MSSKHPDLTIQMVPQPFWWALYHHFPSRIKVKYSLSSFLHRCSILWKIYAPCSPYQQENISLVSAETLLLREAF